MKFFVDSISLKGRVYITAVALAGLPVFFYCIYKSFQEDPSWFVFAVLTFFGGFFPITVPSAKGKTQALSLTVSDVFVFSSILLFGPEVAVTLSVLDGVISNVRARINRLYKHLFNIGLLSITSFLVGKLFYSLVGVSPPLPVERLDESLLLLFFSLGFCGIVFYTLNSGGVALAISLATKQALGGVWKENFFWGSLATIAGASVAVLIYLTFDRIKYFSVLIAVPIILVVYYAYKMNLNRINEAHQHAGEVSELYHSTIASLAMAIDAKDQYTHGHVQRVQALALSLAEASSFDNPSELEGLRAASLLHDIGKLAIPEYILNKPSSLTEWETKKMKIHPTVGADILASVPFPYPVVPFVRYHHERWDGNGYPEGLKTEDIPLGARILSIAETHFGCNNGVHESAVRKGIRSGTHRHTLRQHLRV
jgi:putative nucleotidyltransferase with HDIG domain